MWLEKESKQKKKDLARKRSRMMKDVARVMRMRKEVKKKEFMTMMMASIILGASLMMLKGLLVLSPKLKDTTINFCILNFCNLIFYL